jgi:glucose-6-phosphate 1-epimerase
VAELADAQDLGSCAFNGVGVQLPPLAQVLRIQPVIFPDIILGVDNALIDELNDKFSIQACLTFKKAPGGLIFAEVQNDSAVVDIFLHGAQVTAYVPGGQEPVLFLSGLSHYESNKAIRGGVPISWPWFADHPSDASKPAHGFARITGWTVKKSEILSGGETRITLGLTDSESTRKLLDYSFDLNLDISIGSALNLVLTMKNTDSASFSITSAFHSYFNISSIEDITIGGLENTGYIDKVDGFKLKKQNGPLRIYGETDRIYQHTGKECIIADPGFNRNVRIRKSGSRSTVVWNPWKEKARSMNDLGDADYLGFVCVEVANAGDDIIHIPPGGEHSLGLNVTIDEL